MRSKETWLFFILFTLLFILSSCVEYKGDENPQSYSNYANKFEILHFKGFDLIKVKNPWQKAKEVEFSYCLAESPNNIPDSLSHLAFIKVPVENAIVFSTTHIGYLKALSKKYIVKGASGAGYIFDSTLHSQVESGTISEVGYPPAINFEKILDTKPDLVFLYGIESSIGNISKRIEAAGIPTIIIADYLEQHPLGKAEWIKVFASLTGTKKLADSIFHQVETNYNHLCKLVRTNATRKPGVMLGLPWKDTWYMAGGKSFTAKLLADAGAIYLWAEDNSVDYMPLSVESVMSKALHSDFWLNPGSSRSLDDIIGRDSRYAVFKPYKKGNIYNNDSQLSQNESNNFWEEGVVQPDLVLMDLIKIFHPELLNEHDFVYYRKLE